MSRLSGRLFHLATHPLLIIYSFPPNPSSSSSSSSHSDVVKKIDQSEFEGFEYINPLLMSAEECV